MLSPFIQRRVGEIKSSGNIDFRYVATHDIPGDIASRGMGTKKLQECKLWCYGPNWLNQDQDNWPMWNFYVVSKEILADISKEIKGPKRSFGEVLWKSHTKVKEKNTVTTTNLPRTI